jgi:hypothetical protein
MRFLQSFLANTDGSGSSKRLITLGCFLLFIEIVNVSLFTGKTVDITTMSFLTGILLGSMGLSTNENNIETKANKEIQITNKITE